MRVFRSRSAHRLARESRGHAVPFHERANAGRSASAGPDSTGRTAHDAPESSVHRKPWEDTSFSQDPPAHVRDAAEAQQAVAPHPAAESQPSGNPCAAIMARDLLCISASMLGQSATPARKSSGARGRLRHLPACPRLRRENRVGAFLVCRKGHQVTFVVEQRLRPQLYGRQGSGESAFCRARDLRPGRLLTRVSKDSNNYQYSYSAFGEIVQFHDARAFTSSDFKQATSSSVSLILVAYRVRSNTALMIGWLFDGQVAEQVHDRQSAEPGRTALSLRLERGPSLHNLRPFGCAGRKPVNDQAEPNVVAQSLESCFPDYAPRPLRPPLNVMRSSRAKRKLMRPDVRHQSRMPRAGKTPPVSWSMFPSTQPCPPRIYAARRRSASQMPFAADRKVACALAAAPCCCIGCDRDNPGRIPSALKSTCMAGWPRFSKHRAVN